MKLALTRQSAEHDAVDTRGLIPLVSRSLSAFYSKHRIVIEEGCRFLTRMRAELPAIRIWQIKLSLCPWRGPADETRASFYRRSPAIEARPKLKAEASSGIRLQELPAFCFVQPYSQRAISSVAYRGFAVCPSKGSGAPGYGDEVILRDRVNDGAR